MTFNSITCSIYTKVIAKISMYILVILLLCLLYVKKNCGTWNLMLFWNLPRHNKKSPEIFIGLSFINNLISELQKLRQKVVTEIRSTKQLETDLDQMDIKIGLLIKNRISLQVGIRQSWYRICQSELLLFNANSAIFQLYHGDDKLIIPSPTKLRGDIVTLPSIRHNPCEHSRINILQWILTKLGTYLVLKKIWNPIDFQGHRVKFLPHNILVNTLESTSFNGFWLNLVHT
jgi:hypothetical protein